ncbi:hypothetical protein [Sphaerothrix gracilis]|uniref:hypothetical protein n=1 Tax=Sphaerothrix gracilis TaxID=3151835 RepID=UPI0031FBFF03
MDNLADRQKCYLDFKAQHANLIAGIEGIASNKARHWYATVLLGRLIFVHLLQRQGWIGNGDEWYLPNKLGQSQQQGPDRFYATFLKALFFQGFCLPADERPVEVGRLLGQVPYLGSSLFWPHDLEEQHPKLQIADRVFETLLGWFSENAWSLSEDSEATGINLSLLAQMFERLLLEPVAPFYHEPAALLALWQRSLAAFVLQQVNSHFHTAFETAPDLAAALDDKLCSYLIQTTLPQLSVLDPACGTGSGLLVALRSLVELYQPVLAHAQTSRSPILSAWTKSLGHDAASQRYGLKKRLLSQCIYGSDRAEAAVEIARLQLLLSLVAVAPTASTVEPLPHLDFNITAGDALVGFIRVDEAGVDEISSSSAWQRRRSPIVLQGNLLQPLAAESYRTILAEKNISLEHHRSQTTFMAEMGSLPHYVQAEFLRDRIDQLNQQAQAKLNQLLLSDFSQKYGIQYRTSSTENPKRLLQEADIEALNPVHWGFQFQPILAGQGGFAVILTHPPWGLVGPTPAEFCREYADLLAQAQISVEDFLKHRKSFLAANEAIAAAWQAYESRLAYVNEYLRVSEQYAYQSVGKSARKRLSLEFLYLERCLHLLRPGGFCTLLLPAQTPQEPDAKPLLQALRQQTHLDQIVTYTNDPPWFVGLKPALQFCVVAFQKDQSA